MQHSHVLSLYVYSNTSKLCKNHFSLLQSLEMFVLFRFYRQSNFALPDIDECAGAQPPCQQICKNTKGSYTCECEPGYVVNPLEITKCDGERLVFTTEFFLEIMTATFYSLFSTFMLFSKLIAAQSDLSCSFTVLPVVFFFSVTAPPYTSYQNWYSPWRFDSSRGINVY